MSMRNALLSLGPLMLLGVTTVGETAVSVIASIALAVVGLLGLPAPGANSERMQPPVVIARALVLLALGTTAAAREQLSILAVTLLLLVLASLVASRSRLMRVLSGCAALVVAGGAVYLGIPFLDLAVWAGIWLLPVAGIGALMYSRRPQRASEVESGS